jgi:hypothetical protein
MTMDTIKDSLDELMAQQILEQSEQDPYRLKTDLVKCTLNLSLDEGAHVPDTLTRIRILPTVAVVGQREKVRRPERGSATLIIYVKFLPRSGNTLYQSLKSLGKMVKSLPGVRIVTMLSVGGRLVTHKGEKIVI